MVKVRDVLADAADLTSDGALADRLREGIPSEGEEEKKRKALLRAYNAVMGVTCAEFFPPRRREKVGGDKIFFADLDEVATRIVAAYDGEGNGIGAVVCPTYAVARGAAEIEYEYFPSEKGEEDEHPFDERKLGVRAFAYGVAAEYCLIAGRYEESANWEGKYRAACAGRLTRRRAGKIPARTWGL